MLGGYDGDEVDNDVGRLMRVSLVSILPTSTTHAGQPKVLSDRQLPQQDHPSTAEQMHEVHENNSNGFYQIFKGSALDHWERNRLFQGWSMSARKRRWGVWNFEISAIFAHCLLQIDIDEEGKESLMRLAQGDMRKVLNILQVGTESGGWLAPFLL